jgi:ABC-type sugar transport system substrate-binding protein
MAATKRIVALTLLAALTAAGCSSSKKTAAPSANSSAPAAVASTPAAAASTPAAAASTPAAAASTPAAASSPAAAASGAPIKVGLITKFPVDFYSTMVNAVKAYATAHPNVTVLYAQGKSGTDDASEIAAIQDFVTQDVKAIAITPTSPAVEPALQKAVDKGIKVVLVDNDIPGWTGKSSYVATNNLAGGKVAGTFLAKQLKAGSTIAVLEGVLGNQSLQDRVTGMQQGLGTGFKIVAMTPTDCDQTKGLNAAQDILTAHPDVTAIYGACGPPITGAVQAIKAKGLKGIVVVGFDADPPQIKDILAGNELASVIQFPAKMGSIGIDTAVKAAEGQSVPATVDTGTGLVTKDNAATFQ